MPDVTAAETAVDLSGLPANAIPYLSAAVTYSVDAWMAMFFGGDWGKAEASYAQMLALQAQWTGAVVAASSGAASEADYFVAAAVSGANKKGAEGREEKP